MGDTCADEPHCEERNTYPQRCQDLCLSCTAWARSQLPLRTPAAVFELQPLPAERPGNSLMSLLGSERHYVSSPPTPITLHQRGIWLYRVSPSPGASMPATTPIARSKTAALARILDSVPKGYLLAPM